MQATAISIDQDIYTESPGGAESKCVNLGNGICLKIYKTPLLRDYAYCWHAHLSEELPKNTPKIYEKVDVVVDKRNLYGYFCEFVEPTEVHAELLKNRKNYDLNEEFFNELTDLCNDLEDLGFSSFDVMFKSNNYDNVIIRGDDLILVDFGHGNHPGDSFDAPPGFDFEDYL